MDDDYIARARQLMASYNPFVNALALTEMFDVPDDSDEAIRLAQVHATLAVAQQLSYIHQRMIDNQNRR